MRLIVSFWFFLIFSIKLGYTQHKSVMWEKINLSGVTLPEIGTFDNNIPKLTGDNNWSIGCETLDRDYAIFDNYKKYVGELGASYARIQSGWAKCEQVKGTYNFEWLNNIVDDLLQMKVQPWITLCYGNPIYGAQETLGAKIFSNGEVLDAWLNYVRRTVQEFKNRVTEWEIWNEPNSTNSPEIYANLLMRTAEIIKKVQPEAKIIGLSLAGINLKWTEEVFEILKKNHKEKIVDYLTFHPYVFNPDEAISDIIKLKELATSYNPAINLFQGECGSPSILEWGHALNGYPWTEISQAKWVLRRMVNDWKENIRSSIFTIVDLKYKNMLQSFGLIRTNLLFENIYKRPVFYAVKNTIGLLGPGTTPLGTIENSVSPPKLVTTFRVKINNLEGCLIWFGEEIPSDELTFEYLNITLKEFSIKDPVYMNLITGKIYEIPKQNWKQMQRDLKLRGLPVWDSPMLLIDRAGLKLK